MPRYARLLSVEVVHGYFHAAERLLLNFRPDDQTRAWLERAGCVVRGQENRLEVLFDSDAVGARRPPAATGEPAELRFGVTAEDPLFAEYTEGVALIGRQPITLTAEQARVEDDGALRLAPPASPAPPWAGPRAHLVISLPLAGDLADAGRRYRVRLSTRATRWKYVLLDDWGDLNPCVVDVRDGVAFGEARIEALADGRLRLTTVSDRALPLTERCDRQFQLRAGAEDGAPEAVLIARLPGAAPGHLASAPDGDGLVSEIYVAR